jgi:hypothetical protein
MGLVVPVDPTAYRNVAPALVRRLGHAAAHATGLRWWHCVVDYMRTGEKIAKVDIRRRVDLVYQAGESSLLVSRSRRFTRGWR